MSDLEKQLIIDEAMAQDAGGTVKRQKLDSFRDKKNFISGEKDEMGDSETKKVN